MCVCIKQVWNFRIYTISMDFRSACSIRFLVPFHSLFIVVVIIRGCLLFTNDGFMSCRLHTTWAFSLVQNHEMCKNRERIIDQFAGYAPVCLLTVRFFTCFFFFFTFYFHAAAHMTCVCIGTHMCSGFACLLILL